MVSWREQSLDQNQAAKVMKLRRREGLGEDVSHHPLGLDVVKLTLLLLDGLAQECKAGGDVLDLCPCSATTMPRS